jgi:hypothetical protein
MRIHEEINGFRLIGWVETEVQSTGPCGIFWGENEKEFVTAWYRMGDMEWNHGHYFPKLYGWDKAKQDSKVDFLKRAG